MEKWLRLLPRKSFKSGYVAFIYILIIFEKGSAVARAALELPGPSDPHAWLINF